MKQPIIFISLIMSTLWCSQNRASPAQNIFAETDKSSIDVAETSQIEDGSTPGGPPNSETDTEPVPIDNQIPLLILGAACIIFYSTYHKNKIYFAEKH